MKTFRLCAALLSAALLCGSLSGCQKFHLLRSQSPEKIEEESLRNKDDEEDKPTKDDEFETKVETPIIGDYTSFAGLNMVVLEGVGLVVGLDGTGGDPPPSRFREALVTDMRKRDIRDPESVLRNTNSALVIIRAYMPPLVRKGEAFDIDVYCVDGDTTTSLNGGWLLETELAEASIASTQGVLKGHILAKAKGPIMITTGEGKSDSAGLKLRGKVLGGGQSKKDRDLRVQLRSDFRSVRQSRRIASKIGDRFFGYNESGLREPLAKALTDQTIELKVPSRYKDNYPRYLQVIRNIAFRETPVARHVRMEKLKEQLLDPDTTEQAALQLEAIGAPEAVPVLKTGLKNPDPEVRFNAAYALAYLGQADGIKALGEAAVDQRAFRVYALAALATLDEAESHLLLRDLMSAQTDSGGKTVDSAELRYGSFRALWTLDKRDPYLSGEPMKDQADHELFTLHSLPTKGEPMIHLTQHRRSEIVLFGEGQQFRTPLACRAGTRILVTAQPGKDKIVVARYEPGQPDKRKEVSTRVADVIRTIVEFGGSYPDVAQMLLQASKQQNLMSHIEIDALPQSGREYVRKDSKSNGSKKVRIGNPNLVPNFVPTLKNTVSPVNEKQSFGEAIEQVEKEKPTADQQPSVEKQVALTNVEPTEPESGSNGSASVADARNSDPVPQTERRKFEFWKRK